MKLLQEKASESSDFLSSVEQERTAALESGTRQLLGGYIWQTQLESTQEHLVDGGGNS